MGATVTVELAGGTGWVARRPDAVLWTPSEQRPDELLSAFLAPDRGADAVAGVTAAVIDAGFDVEPFALVSWAAGPHLVVLGAVEVNTDVPSVPMLSGRGSRTWVEHRPDAMSATIHAGDDIDAGTDLVAGVARAGGFRLRLDAADEHARLSSIDTADLPVTQLAPMPEPPEPELAWAPEPDLRAAPPPDSGASLLRTVTGGDWMEDSIGVTGPLLAAATVAEPIGRSAGTLLIDGDAAAALDGVVVIGRRPDATSARVGAASSLCAVTGNPAVSRTHLVVRTEHGAVSATDCGSSSGSILVGAGGQTEPMTPWTPYAIDAGDVVYLGGPTTVQIEH